MGVAAGGISDDQDASVQMVLVEAVVFAAAARALAGRILGSRRRFVVNMGTAGGVFRLPRVQQERTERRCSRSLLLRRSPSFRRSNLQSRCNLTATCNS